MRKALVSTLFALFAGLLLASPVPVAAQGNHVRERVRAGQFMPLDRLLPSVRRGHPGTFYDAQGPELGPHGGYHYRLKWLTPQGRVVWLNTDARTGRVLGVEAERHRRVKGWRAPYAAPRFGGGPVAIPPPPPSWPPGEPPPRGRRR